MIAAWLVAVLMIPVQQESSGARKASTIEVKVGKTVREALVYEPVEKAPKPFPTVMVFHGHGGQPLGASRSMSFQKAWPEALVVFPKGVPTPGRLTDPEGKRSGWQHRVGDHGDRDLLFFDALLKELGQKRELGDLFVTGHSNGGGFSYLLMGQRPEKIKAVAASACGGRPAPQGKPRPVMHIAGRTGPLVLFANQSQTIEAWKTFNRCGEEGVPWERVATRYASPLGCPVVTFIHDGDHKYPVEAVPLIVRFFKEQAAAPAPLKP